MKSLLLCLLAVLALQPSAHSQVRKSAMKVARIEPQTPKFEGDYHKIPGKATPLGKKMAEANFCEFEGNYVLVPDCEANNTSNGLKPVIELSLDKIKQLLDDDIINFYGLEDTFDTPLKKKKFRENPENKALVDRFNQIKSCVLNSEFYIVQPIKSAYDLNKHTFTIYLPYSDYRLKSENRHFEYDYYTTKEIDEDTAYKIECGESELVVFVRFNKESDYEPVCEPVKVYIADGNTGEIFYEHTIATADNSSATNDVMVVEENKDLKVVEEEEKIYTSAEQMPVYPGGDQGLLVDVSKILEYPDVAKEKGLEGKVTVMFVVKKDGSIGEVKVARGKDPDLDKAAVRAVKALSKKFTPGKMNGLPINVWYSIPVTFRLKH